MNLSFYYMLIVIMISRLIFQFKDESISLKNTIIKSIIEIIALIAISTWSLNTLWGIFSLVALNAMTYFFDKAKIRNRFINRLLILVLYCFTLSIFFPKLNNLISLNSLALSIKAFLEERNFLFFIIKQITWKYTLILLSGALLVANEVNHIIRYLLSKFKFKEPTNDEKKNSIDLSRGRIIGIIERLLIYYFVIEGDITSIGFVLAAKSFTRFKELDDRNFAEYVLIGTLLSAFLAVVTGILIKKSLM